MLIITTPAADYTLLTIEEMRAAAGVADDSQDAALIALEAEVADAMTTECNVAIGNERPTLRRETVTETFRKVEAPVLLLARRHQVDIDSVTVDGEASDTDEFEANSEAGTLHRLDRDTPIPWAAGKIVVVYLAGFSTVPADLKKAAAGRLRMAWLTGQRDPSLKSEEVDIPGVLRERTDYFQTPGTADQADPLTRYRNQPI